MDSRQDPRRSDAVPPPLPGAGAVRAVLQAAADAQAQGEPAALALVLEAAGSTYVRAGAVALFGADRQVGWLSGGCLEPEIAARAHLAADAGRIEWLEIDTRSDEDLLSGSAVGCRGHLRLALLPLPALQGWSALVRAWREGEGTLHIALHADGTIEAAVGTQHLAHRYEATALAWDAPRDARWSLALAPPPRVIVLGAGPETPVLLPLLRTLGAMTTLVERRPRWVADGALADRALALSPGQALRGSPQFDAALVMHHHFELDREALAALAECDVGFIGLLGPTRRREDLFRVLPATVHASLLPRLHSPVGLHLGGHGPEAIALSIAAQLQRHLHGGLA